MSEVQPASPASPTSPPSKDIMHTPYREWRVLTISCLTSIATIIGSGILALPVTLYGTSVPVFLSLFTFTLFAQSAVVFAVIELLQRAAMEPPETPSYSAIERQPREVSLFCLARHYLPSTFLRYVFYISTFLCFVSLLVSYGLAGPQAVWQLVTFGPTTNPPQIVFAVYWALGTGAVVFFIDALLGVFGSFTVLKGALFVGVVGIVAALPTSARPTSLGTLFSDFSGWGHASSSLLVSCVALGGLSNTMPVTFKLLPARPSKAQVARYRFAIILAIVLCYILNVGWVLAILQVVPRVDEPGKPSLTNAYNLGQISTVPLIDALHSGGAIGGTVLKSIEIIVELFIFVSTGVSFFVCSAGMKSFVDGGAANLAQGWRNGEGGTLIPKVGAYVLSFGSVLVIVLLNPNGFIAVLTRFSSIAVNLQAGVCIIIMLYFSRKMSFKTESDNGPMLVELGQAGAESAQKGNIPLEMRSSTAWTVLAVGLPFFIAACLLAVAGPFLGIKLNGGG